MDEINGIMVGKVVGNLTVVEMGPRSGDSTVWRCACSCGKEVIVSTNNLSKGKVTHCGCETNGKNKEYPNLVGTIHGNLDVVSHSYSDTWLCKCICGNTVELHSSAIKIRLTCGCRKRTKEAEEKAFLAKEYRRASTEYAEWRTFIFLRDKYSCAKCGEGRKVLNAHHIEGYAGNEEGRLNINNGITLCVACHKQFHKTYGVKAGVTEENFKKFMC